MIAQKEFTQATHLSNEIFTVLVISTIIGVFIWLSIFCSAVFLIDWRFVIKKIAYNIKIFVKYFT